MPRLLFSKEGSAVWISHLDLMRLFQRAFKRAGFKLTHSHGFNPRPSVSIALPLSVGTSSKCELLDFQLDIDAEPQEIKERLNNVLIEGIQILDVYCDVAKIREIAFMESQLEMQYDIAVSTDMVNNLQKLFLRDSLVVERKTKSGTQDQDIMLLIKKIYIETAGGSTFRIRVIHCCQNPTLNPVLIVAAISKYLPEAIPTHVKCSRIEIFDHNMNIFR